MSGLLGFLLRNASGLLKDGAEIFIGQALVRTFTQRLKSVLIFYSVMGVLAVIALIFFYVLAYRFLSERLDDVSAAAILCGAHLLAVVLMLIGKALHRPKPVVAASPIAELLKSHAGGLVKSGGLVKGGGLAKSEVNFDAGIAIGQQIGQHIRKATPHVALAAVVMGLAIGARPQILGLFRRRAPPPRKS